MYDLNRNENIKRKRKNILSLFKQRWRKRFLQSKNFASTLDPFSAEEEQQWPAGCWEELAQMCNISADGAEPPQQPPGSLIPLPWRDTWQGGRGRGQGCDGHSDVKMSWELHGESCAPDNKQTTAWAQEQRRRTCFLARGQAVAQLAMGCSQPWGRELVSAHGKAINPCHTAQLVGPREVLLHREPHVLLVLPKPAQAEAQICALHCQLSSPASAQGRRDSTEPRHPLSSTFIHTQNVHRARAPAVHSKF